MCDVCSVFNATLGRFDCPQVTEWPDSPFTTEERIREDHAWARFKRENQDRAQELIEQQEECDHSDHHKQIQEWQGVTLVAKVCDRCGATANLFDNL